MTTGIPDGAPSQGWRICEACGQWQRAVRAAACSRCQWPRLLIDNPGGIRAENAFRVLVEAEVHSGATWRLSAISTARIVDAFDQAALVERISNGGASRLLRSGEIAEGEVPPRLHEWEQFREKAREALTEEFKKLIQRNWPSPTTPTDPAVMVSIRVLLLDPDAAASESSNPTWLEIIPFQLAVTDAANKLRDNALVIDCSRTKIDFSPGGGRIEATLTSTSALLVDSWEVRSAPNSEGEGGIWKGSFKGVVRPNVQTAMPSVALSADAVRGLASHGAALADRVFRVFVRGRSKPFESSLPMIELPAFGSVADLFLDLGSTTTKWAVRLEDRETVAHDQDTLGLTESWGIEAYRKDKLIEDATGELWCRWIARALPALRCWVGRERSAYLRHVYVSLPTTDRFNVSRLRREVEEGFRDASRAADEHGNSKLDVLSAGSAKHLLGAASNEHLVASGRVVLFPEHVLVAEHYLNVLRILQTAARRYANRFDGHERKRQRQQLAQKSYDATARDHREYEAKSFWTRWAFDEPARPAGDRPTIPSKISDPAAWMRMLIEHPEQLDHVVLLDAGGLSLDISVLEKHTLDAALSHSHATCGGEVISRRIGRKECGPRGTRYKARLGLRWHESRDISDPAQREYRDATRAVYERPLKHLFANLRDRWTKARYSCVLLTGGGSRNPHLAKYINELAGEAGLDVKVFDAAFVQGLIRQARKFPEPLADLDSSPITWFEEAQRWSEARERQPVARYDKFAVVGGMCAFEIGKSK